jgi:hypothetical protein
MMTICWNGRFYLSLETLDEKAAGLDFFGRGLNNVEHQPARKPVFFVVWRRILGFRWLV